MKELDRIREITDNYEWDENKNLDEQIEKFYEEITPSYSALRLTDVKRQHYWKTKKQETLKDVKDEIETMVKRTFQFYEDPCGYITLDDCNRHFCERDCENCISKRHWTDIINNRPHHFVDKDNDVFYITSVEKGGFGRQKYLVTLETGEEFECGLWYNGDCTDMVAEQIPKGERKAIY